MNKICIVTTSRSEYSHLKWMIKQINDDIDLELQLVVTGAHLCDEQGYTINEIYNDGFPIMSVVDVNADNTSKLSIAKTMSKINDKIADVFDTLKPDILMVLGDRYELLPICAAAFLMDIQIGHVSGGDITEGAIDDGIRNAITMLATYHFPGNTDSALNISRMKNSEKNIFTVGELSLDLFNNEKLLSRMDLAENLELCQNKEWVLLTYHPETKETLSYNMDAIQNIIKVLQEISNIEVVITGANMDYGGKEINYFLAQTSNNDKKFKFFPSLGQLRYLSLMKQVFFVIGNSSSGIVETPFLSVPAINIGNRQKGRHLCNNIIQSGYSCEEIKAALGMINLNKNINDRNYWGDGKSTGKIVEIIKKCVK